MSSLVAAVLVFSALFAAAFIPLDHRLSAPRNWQRSTEIDFAGVRQQTLHGTTRRRVAFIALFVAFIFVMLWIPFRVRLQLTPIVVATTAWLGWETFSVLWSVNTPLSLRRLPSWIITAVVGFFAGAALGVKGCLMAIALVCAAYLVAGIANELLNGTRDPEIGYRFAGTLHPNQQALNCALLAFSSCWLGATESIPSGICHRWHDRRRGGSRANAFAACFLGIGDRSADFDCDDSFWVEPHLAGWTRRRNFCDRGCGEKPSRSGRRARWFGRNAERDCFVWKNELRSQLERANHALETCFGRRRARLDSRPGLRRILGCSPPRYVPRKSRHEGVGNVTPRRSRFLFVRARSVPFYISATMVAAFIAALGLHGISSALLGSLLIFIFLEGLLESFFALPSYTSLILFLLLGALAVS